MSELFPGQVQNWAVNFSNGLEYVNTIPDLHQGVLRIFNSRIPTFQPSNFSWAQLEADSQTETVKFYLHTLKWLDQLIEDAASESATAAASGELALDIAHEWWNQHLENPRWLDDEYVWGGHGFALRATTLTALSGVWPEEQWIAEALEFHGAKLIAEFDGYWNHGLVQALALICVAGRLADSEALDEGVQRTQKCLDVMIDDEGCINEQAPEYSRYIERLLRVAIRVFKLNKVGDVDRLEAKKVLIREFIAHSLKPDLTFIELGDSAPRTPSYMKGTPIEYVMSSGILGQPIDKVKTYQGGFVFGRSGFGNRRPLSAETYYTLRFGPQRIIHGHNDHLSMTYWDHGRPVIIDPGHVGYTPGAARSYVRSHHSHNIPYVHGERHDWSAHTNLDEELVRDDWQSFVLSDQGYARYSRQRNAFFADNGPFVVADSVTGIEDAPSRYMVQRWNVAPEFDLKGANSEMVKFESSADGLTLYLIRYAIDESGEIHGHTALDLHYGDETQMLGYVAQHERLMPCWNVGFGKTGTNLRLVTMGLVALPGDEVGWSFRQQSQDLAVLRAHIGSNSWSVNVNLESLRLTGRSVPTSPVVFGDIGIGYAGEGR